MDQQLADEIAGMLGAQQEQGGRVSAAHEPRRLRVLRYHVPECDNETGVRPCPNTRCRYALAVDEVTGATESCSLDVAARGGVTLAAIGVLTGVTRQAVEQQITSALRAFRAKARAFGRKAAVAVAPMRSVRFCAWCASVVVAPRARFCDKECAAKHRGAMARLAYVSPEKRRAYLTRAVARMAELDRGDGAECIRPEALL